MQSVGHSESAGTADIAYDTSSNSLAMPHINKGSSQRLDIRFVAINHQVGDLTTLSLFSFQDPSRRDLERISMQKKRWTVTYPSQGLLAIGENPLAFPIHSDVRNGVAEAISIAKDDSSLQRFSQRFNYEEMRLSAVDGFRYGKNFVVRIEDISDRLSDRTFLIGELEKYSRAIEINRIAALQSGGTVQLLVMGEDRETRAIIPKMLGLNYLVVEQDQKFPGPAYIEKMRQFTNGGSVYYSDVQRIRYILPDAIRNLASDELMRDFKTFMEAITEYNRWLNPIQARQLDSQFRKDMNEEARDSQRIEARILVLDPHTEAPIFGETERKLSGRFHEIVLSTYYSKDNWNTERGRICNELILLAREQELCLPACLAADNPRNSEFARIMGTILRSTPSNLSVSKDFSTPVHAVQFGFFANGADGKRDFQVASSESNLHLIATWALNNFPELISNDWFDCLEPEIPLTFDRHPPLFVRQFGDLREENYVITFGNVGEREQRRVIKGNVYGVSKWVQRDTPWVNEVREHISDAILTEGVELDQHANHDLAHGFLRAGGAHHSKIADKFEPITRADIGMPELCDIYSYHDGDLLHRLFYDGDRCDRMPLTTMTYEQIAGLLEATGELAAVNFMIQGPAFDLSNLVVNREKEGGVPDEVVMLGTSDSFSNSLRAKNRAFYMQLTKIRDADHAATIIQAFLNGLYANTLTSSELAALRGAKCESPPNIEVKDEAVAQYVQLLRQQVEAANKAKELAAIETSLIDVFVNSFRRQLLGMIGEGRAECERMLDLYQAKNQSWIRENSGGTKYLRDFDRTKGYNFSRELLMLRSEEVEEHCGELRDSISLEGEDKRRILTRRSVDDPDASMPNYEMRRELLITLNGLVNNHLPEYDDFLVLGQILNGKGFPLSGFSIEEKKYLFDFIDFAVWAKEVKLPHETCDLLLKIAAETANCATFLFITNPKSDKVLKRDSGKLVDADENLSNGVSNYGVDLNSVRTQLVGFNPPGQLLSNLYQSVHGLLNLSDFEDTSDPRRVMLSQFFINLQGILGHMAKFGDTLHLDDAKSRRA